MATSVLSIALDKLRGGKADEIPDLTEEEARALSSYLTETASATAVSPSEQVLCRHIRATLQARATRAHAGPSKPPEATYQRTNNTLRAAIDLMLVGDFALVQERDVRLLRETEARLQKMSQEEEPSPNQRRLSNLVSKCLANYSAWVTDNPRKSAEPVPPVEAVPSNGKGTASGDVGVAETASANWQVQDLLAAAGQREKLDELEGIPTIVNVRRVEHVGDLTIEGDCPDDILLEVREGHLTIRGAVSGYIVSDSDVCVEGNIQGGWVFVRRGKFSANRVLAGSTVISPRGDLALGAVENASLLYSGGNCRIEGDCIGVTVFANDLHVGGLIRNARLHVRGRLRAATVEMSARDDTFIRFRAAQSCLDYGRPIPDEVANDLRHLARLHFRCHVDALFLRLLTSERLNCCRARIFGLRAESDPSAQLRTFRTGHALHAGLQQVLEVGESLKEVFALGLCLGEPYSTSLVRGALEEVAAQTSHIVKEAQSLSKEFVGDTESLESPCRHINSFSKKLKEALSLNVGVDKLFYDFDFRLDEWRETAEKMRAQYSGALPDIVEVIGDSIFELTDCEKLEALAITLEKQAPDSRMRSVEMRALKQNVSQYGAMERQWKENLERAQEEYGSVVSSAASAIDLVVARRGDRGVTADAMADAVPIQTLALGERASGRDGTSWILAVARSPYQAKCEHLRLFEVDEGKLPHR